MYISPNRGAKEVLISLLFLFSLFLFSVKANASTCKIKRPENFAIFFKSFSAKNPFAVARTVYPLRYLKWEYGLDEKGNDDSSPVLMLITKSQDQSGISLLSYMQENNLAFEIKEVSKKTATVTIFQAQSDWKLEYHFVQKNRCWFLREIENLSP
jgi:hypothetical protein